jgi:hypothetical protein
MHLLESSLFVDQVAACGASSLCYVRNDHFDKVNFTIAFEAWALEDVVPRRIYEYKDELEAGSIDWFELPSDFTSDVQVSLIRLEVCHDSASSDPRITESVYLTDMPKNIKGLKDPIHIEIIDIHATENGDAAIVLESDKLALYVVLTTRANGLFSHNCMSLRPFEQKVSMGQKIISQQVFI